MCVCVFRYKEAFEWSKLAAEQEPDWEHAYDIMGKVLHKLGNRTNAVKTLKKAVSYIIFPLSLTLLYNYNYL